jgi:hypothetical protein
VVRCRALPCAASLARADGALRRADALPTLLDERDYGLLTSVLSFLQGLVTADSSRRVPSRGALARVRR